jgi:Calcineurin-like phosphoesterase
MEFSLYDVIGDIHGHADELVRLLETLDYREGVDGYRHATRTAVFCGDFIDRGPQIRSVLQIVRPMVESGAARAVLGNHEFNAIAFHTPRSDAPAEFYRPHIARNLHQHSATVSQLPGDELTNALAWFCTLPMALDLGDLRVVHACWDPDALQLLASSLQDCSMDSETFLRAATTIGNPVFDAIECVLKGPELKLPDGLSVLDKDGATRTRTRIRWFEPPGTTSWGEYCLPAKSLPQLQDIAVPEDCPCVPYAKSDPPVFIGHYWLPDPAPRPLTANVACVDYSVARGGMLCAYRSHGERVLSAEHFVTVPCQSAP